MHLEIDATKASSGSTAFAKGGHDLRASRLRISISAIETQVWPRS